MKRPIAPPGFIPFPREDTERTIQERFEAVVARFPERPAVVMGEETWTYARLNEAANRVARAILDTARPESEPIALLAAPSPVGVIGILASLKAGRPWIPLHHTDPQDRLAEILRLAGTAQILTDQENLARAYMLSGDHGSVFPIETLIRSGPDRDLRLSIHPDSLALVTFTSGSTGRPKGVMYSHRTVLNNIMVHTNTLYIVPEDRFSHVAGYSSLAGLSSIFRGLLNGGCVLPFDAATRGPAELGGWMDRQKITVCQLVPTLFRHAIRSLSGTESFSAMRIVHLGGEAVVREDVHEFRKRFPTTCLLLHNLGASEAPTFRQFFIGHDTEIPSERVPVGYPVPDREVILVDEHDEPVGFDRPGEIVVKSRYLALGYWKDPELTRARFRPDPADGEIRRFYTGDLGIMQSDGCLVHLGRKDDQVKIFGHLVVPAEIEAALAAVEGVAHAAVVAQEEEEGPRLAAYVVPRPGDQLSEIAIRRALAGRLPRHMIPAEIRVVERLPTTTAGKVDRKALRSSEKEAPPTPLPLLFPPAPDLERTVTAICEQVLGKPLGGNDDLLDLGCDSLRAAIIQSRIARAVGITIPFSAFFDRPTPARLAQRIRERTTP